jgi:signal transduction histidine kinase/CheY-like chemotaxis protein
MPVASQRLDLRATEELRSVADNLVQTVAATAFASSALLYLLHDTVGEPLGAIWLALLNCVGVVRLNVLWRLRSRALDDPANRPLMRTLMSCALTSGLIWAASVWVLSAPAQYLQVVVMFACLAIATGGAFATVASLPTAYSIFIPPILAPFVFGITHEGRYYHTVGVMALVYGVILARMIYLLNGQFRRQIAVREENAGLLDELRSRTAEAEAANEAKSRFLIAASHDLRQPMQVIVLRAQALADTALPPAAREAATRLDQAVSTLHSLFDELLDVSRLDAGAIDTTVQPFALQSLFARLEESYTDVTRDSAVEWCVVPTELWIQSDERLLERILRQLLDNAVRHAIRRSITLSARSLDGEVAIEVHDTGPGVPLDKQADIFKEFVQLDNPQRDRSRGLGLGLAIADRLARLLSHRIVLESEPGHGAAFRVIVAQAQSRPATTPTPPPAHTDTLTFDGMLVAILDDTPDVLHLLEVTLQRWHCETIAATHSEQLTQILLQTGRRPDLLVCDYRLAEPRNGIQVIAELRSGLGITCPALLITGDIAVHRDDRLTALNITLMQKPVRVAALRNAIRAAVPDRLAAAGA